LTFNVSACLQRQAGGLGAGNRGGVAHLVLQRGAADLGGIGDRLGAFGGVDDEARSRRS
jgi:hypothetical protein